MDKAERENLEWLYDDCLDEIRKLQSFKEWLEDKGWDNQYEILEEIEKDLKRWRKVRKKFKKELEEGQ